MAKISRALLSVYNKEGIVLFARGLRAQGVELLSTGGTYSLLTQEGIAVREVSSYTGFPEILEGRVKTLHPVIYGGILAKREKAQHQQEMAKLGVAPIDLVVVNLYPFQQTVAKPSVTLDEALENIDVGGPTLLRASAKNYKDVIVIVDPEDYPTLLNEIAQGDIAESKRLTLAQKAFHHTARYDKAIFSYLSGIGEPCQEKFPENLTTTYTRVQSLRYGENPHQEAAFYRGEAVSGGWGDAKILWGKEMSYNNFLDADSALALVSEFEMPAAVVVKHNNPCGVATAETPLVAFKNARATDPTSAFGGVVAVNCPITEGLAEEITSTFMEVVVAPDVEPGALAVFQKKKNLRVITVSPPASPSFDFRKIAGGLLVQDPNQHVLKDATQYRVVTHRTPTSEEVEALLFSWKVCKHVKSNAIILAHPGVTVGIGAGQMSRVDSVQIAMMKAQSPVTGTVMASDAFFPFRDGIDMAGKAGIRAIIQPGGSIRDAEVIDAANEHGMAMVFTGIRHFRH
jgi:phosphoribosylaminoimidazolecarboxamide formyltransferase/IMP cyclohydrolase